MDCIRQGERRARKNHRCDLCGRQINEGELYCFQVCVEGGDLWENRLHEKCMGVCQDYSIENKVHEYDFDHVWEWYLEQS